MQIDQPTRQRVVRALLERRTGTAADLADALGLTAAGIRRHLDHLAEDRHVEQVDPTSRTAAPTRGRGRPARLFRVTDAGRAELEAFAAAAAKPSVIRDDLLVKVQAGDRVGTASVIVQLEERARAAEAKLELLRKLLRGMRGDADEEEFLRRGERIGGYLTCLRGVAFEEGHRDWCLRAAAVLKERSAPRDEH